MKIIMEKLQSSILFIFRNVTTIACIGLALVLITCTVSSIMIDSTIKDIYYGEKNSISRLYQDFLDSSAGKIERMIHEREIENKDIINYNKIINGMHDEFSSEMSFINNGLDVYTFIIDKDRHGNSKISIMVEDVLYRYHKTSDGYILYDEDIARKVYRKNITEITNNSKIYNEMTSRNYIIDDHPLLSSHLVKRLNECMPTNSYNLNEFKYKDIHYYLNISILPRYNFFESTNHRMKLGFLTVYNENFINKSIKEPRSKLEFLRKSVSIMTFLNVFVSISLIISSQILLQDLKHKKKLNKNTYSLIKDKNDTSSKNSE